MRTGEKDSELELKFNFNIQACSSTVSRIITRPGPDRGPAPSLEITRISRASPDDSRSPLASGSRSLCRPGLLASLAFPRDIYRSRLPGSGSDFERVARSSIMTRFFTDTPAGPRRMLCAQLLTTRWTAIIAKKKKKKSTFNERHECVAFSPRYDERAAISRVCRSESDAGAVTVYVHIYVDT